MFIRRSPRNDINILCSESHGYSQICFFPFLTSRRHLSSWPGTQSFSPGLVERNVSVVSISFICIVSLSPQVVNFAKNENYLHIVIFTQKQIRITIIFYPSCEPLGRRGFSTKDCMLPACDNLSNVE